MTEDIKVVSDDYRPGYYEQGYDDDPYSSGTIAGVGEITSEVTGALREMVLAKATQGEDALVTIIERHWDAGYCVTCSYEQVTFIIEVDGEEVYRAEDYEADSPFAALQAWLTGGESE